MTAMPQRSKSSESWPPLWSIGLAVAVMLIVPLVLFHGASRTDSGG